MLGFKKALALDFQPKYLMAGVSISDPSSPVPLFVYGTLKPGEFFYPHYCEGHVVAEQAAIVRGQLFALPLGYPALAEGGDWVYGYLLSLRSAAALQKIDALEDYDAQRPTRENEYYRVEIEVFDLQQNSLGKAWTYLMEIKRIQVLRGQWLPKGIWTGS